MGINLAIFKIVLATCVFSSGVYSEPCVSRDYGYGSVVCVCNSTYCDSPESTTLQQLESGVVRHYVTSKAGQRLEVSNTNFSTASWHYEATSSVIVNVSQDDQYQSIFGYGGAISDAAAINTYSLSAEASDKLIRAYFSEEGIGYTFVRVPIGPTDFSSHYYEYTGDYEYDVTLKHFNITEEDTAYKMPFLKRAEEVSPRKVKLFATVWTAPQWMKEINNSTGKSNLKKEYYSVYANYYTKFLDAYSAGGLTFWGITPQNEPGVAAILGVKVSMGWTAQNMLQFLVEDLCPALNNKAYGDLKVMLLDDNRSYLPQWLQILKNDTARSCISGIAIHWYSDKSTSVSILDEAHNEYPDKFIIYTEACPERNSGDQRVVLGYWKDGAQYISSIIEVTNNWVGGWVDWNMAIDLTGGPNWLNDTRDDAPVVVNATSDEFYKQPTFYAIAHFSKFVPPGSVRIGLSIGADSLEGVAFLTPDRATVIILHNKEDTELKAVVSDSVRGTVTLDIPARSMHTILYK